MTDRYDDIIDLPHPVSRTHAPMPRRDRAAQFSPFSALTGYDALIRESARQTQEKRIPDEQRKSEINRRLAELRRNENNMPHVRVTFFAADEKKNGGGYVALDANIRRVDEYTGKLLLPGGIEIDMADIWDIESEMYDAGI